MRPSLRFSMHVASCFGPLSFMNRNIRCGTFLREVATTAVIAFQNAAARLPCPCGMCSNPKHVLCHEKTLPHSDRYARTSKTTICSPRRCHPPQPFFNQPGNRETPLLHFLLLCANRCLSWIGYDRMLPSSPADQTSRQRTRSPPRYGTVRDSFFRCGLTVVGS